MIGARLMPTMLACLLVCGMPRAHAGDADEAPSEKLVFGMTPVIGVEATRERFFPLANHLTSLLGIKVKLEVAESYGDLIDQVAKGEVDLVKFSPLAYVRAKERIPDLRLIAAHVAYGSKTYSSYLVTMQDGTFGSLADLHGARICFADPDSTSGYLYPVAYLLEHKIVPDTTFRSITFGGNHRACIAGLIAGRFDVAATFSGAIRDARQAGLPVGDLFILAKTGRIPYDAYCLRGGLDESLAVKIKSVLLKINTLSRTGRRVLDPTLGINGWIEADDHLYDGVRQVDALVTKYQRK
ncbi:MAG TPA: phosphate/phosphite/phosphonate ABC transporter substrate-binding protein [Myxococcota bacterium]|nr:phosphate/phosphite/phosphonate ABC transporter substrate-binding protein [Myxococcota bacterium]